MMYRTKKSVIHCFDVKLKTKFGNIDREIKLSYEDDNEKLLYENIENNLKDIKAQIDEALEDIKRIKKELQTSQSDENKPIPYSIQPLGVDCENDKEQEERVDDKIFFELIGEGQLSCTVGE